MRIVSTQEQRACLQQVLGRLFEVGRSNYPLKKKFRRHYADMLTVERTLDGGEAHPIIVRLGPKRTIELVRPAGSRLELPTLDRLRWLSSQFQIVQKRQELPVANWREMVVFD
ncbi:hypothetical protein H6783_03690 [Candidatus Nomurabacteria bacterium]|nr:hypothetical protein [Candidatus Nomurabacteria bacterium]